jgi:hypothetical protein
MLHGVQQGGIGRRLVELAGQTLTAQLTPRSWPSSTYLTTASPPPNKSEFICNNRDQCQLQALTGVALHHHSSSDTIDPRNHLLVASCLHGCTCGSRSTSSPPGETVFLRRPLMSQTRTVWSRLADATRSSVIICRSRCKPPKLHNAVCRNVTLIADCAQPQNYRASVLSETSKC